MVTYLTTVLPKSQCVAGFGVSAVPGTDTFLWRKGPVMPWNGDILA